MSTLLSVSKNAPFSIEDIAIDDKEITAARAIHIPRNCLVSTPGGTKIAHPDIAASGARKKQF